MFCINICLFILCFRCNLIPTDVLTIKNKCQIQHEINISWTKTKYIRWAFYIADVAMLEKWIPEYIVVTKLQLVEGMEASAVFVFVRELHPCLCIIQSTWTQQGYYYQTCSYKTLNLKYFLPFVISIFLSIYHSLVQTWICIYDRSRNDGDGTLFDLSSKEINNSNNFLLIDTPGHNIK